MIAVVSTGFLTGFLPGFLRCGTRGIWAAAAIVAGVFVGAPAQAEPLAGYRALYDLSNSKLSDRSGLRDITGLMALGFEGSTCDGYSSTARVALKINRRNGPAILSDLKTTSWEDGKGINFRFTTRQSLNGRVTEDVSGRAKLTAPDKSGSGTLLRPSRKSFDLPEGAVFPTDYTARVITAALNGKRFYKSLVFDGTDNDKTVSAVAFIGALKPAGTLKPPFKLKAEQQLARLKAWPVDISYFEIADKRSEQTPTYRAQLLLYENGVVTNLSMHYSDFSLKGTLRSLEVSKLPNC